MKTDLNITTNADGILRASECGLIFGGYGEWDEQAISGFGENYYTEIPLHNARIIQSLLDMAEDRPAVNESNPEGLTTVLLPPGVICVGADVFRRGQTCLWINHDYTRLLGSGTPEKIGASPVDCGGTVIKTPFRYNEGIKGEYRAAAIRIRGREYGNASRAARHHVFIENFTLDGGGEWTGEYEWDSSDKRDKDYGWDITHHGINVSVDDLVDYVIIKNITVKNFRGEMMYIGGHNTGYLEVTRCVVGGTNASCNNLDGHTVYCHENQWGLEDS
ncbi:MAG: hypothetical protein FWF03_04815, partial [Defluviitaleaceae bacterium]|nr:hypothetical protein [Defluviitaleaceae bacterium]